MKRNHETNSFKKLLDKLQEDSWQMELIISGFAIFGLFYAFEPIVNLKNKALFNDNRFTSIFLSIISISILILIFNLLLHVILRGLWIGSLGLRYVSGEIDYEKLDYSEKFTKYLKKKVGSFDSYIDKLENLCSIIFAIAFLMIFYVVAVFLLGFIVSYFVRLYNDIQSEWIQKGVLFPLIVIFGIGVFMTFADFITQGLLKKNKWISKIYFPFYWVFSMLTLSFLYRPLVYNFLDNKFGKRIISLLFPFYLIIVVISSLHYQKSSFITISATGLSNANIANGRSYKDIIDKDDDIFIDAFAIQSKVITAPYIKVIVPLVKAIEEPLIEFSPDLSQKEDKRGLKSDIINGWDSYKDKTNYDSIINTYLSSFEKYYSFKIDSTTYKTDFVVTNIGNDLGFESYIGIKNISEGKHVINFQKVKHKDTDSIISIRKVPFWYYKN